MDQQHRPGRSRVPAFAVMSRLPGGLMLVPLALGVLTGTFAPAALEIGSFTTALFDTGAALTLIALLVLATGAQITGSHSGRGAAATTVVVLVAKTLIPAGLAVALGFAVGIEGIAGVSVLALLAAVVPFLLGLAIGGLDREWTSVLTAVPNVVVPFMSFAIGTGIDLRTVLTGGAAGLVLGVLVVAFTGGLTYLGYRLVLRRGADSGIGFAAGTTAGNAVAVPAVVAAADPRFAPFVAPAAAQAAAAVLVTALLAPAVAAWTLRRARHTPTPADASRTKFC